MSHQIEQMIYLGATPWHGLGTRLDVAPASTAEAIKLAGLDWTIAMEQLQLPDGTAVDRFAVVRQSDRSVLGTVGNVWEPVQNAKAFEPFEPFIAGGHATIETAGSLRGGRRVWMLAKLNRADSVIVPQADDRVAKYLLVAIGHDGTLAFRIGYTPIRVVCNNTLSVAIHSKESTYVRLPHLSGVNAAIDKVTTTIAGVDARFEKTAEVFRALAARKIRNVAELHAYVDAVYPPAKTAAAKTLGEEVTPGAESFADLLTGAARISETTTTFIGQAPVLAEQAAVEETRRRIRDEIEYLFTQGKGNALAGVAGTAWAAYNAVTDHLTWHRGGAKNQDSRLENLWLSNSGPVSRALPAAVDTFLNN